MSILNQLSPAPGSHKKHTRVGRGIGSGSGKTANRGHKGQKSRSGGSVKPGFEGGQQPLQRRLPKYGFSSRKSIYATEIRLRDLNTNLISNTDVVDLLFLKNFGLVKKKIKKVKIISTGSISQAISLKGIDATKEARIAIENAGGKFLEG